MIFVKNNSKQFPFNVCCSYNAEKLKCIVIGIYLIGIFLAIDRAEGWGTTYSFIAGHSGVSSNKVAVTTIPALFHEKAVDDSSSSYHQRFGVGCLSPLSTTTRFAGNRFFAFSNRRDKHAAGNSSKVTSRERNNRRILLVSFISVLILSLSSPRSAAATVATGVTDSILPAATTVATTAAATRTTANAVPLVTARMLQSPVPWTVELRLSLRLFLAALMGAAVGKERSATHKHSAGVRTMALVSVGAACFTVCSMFGFLVMGSAKYDPSRMASNIATGVGFVGAGVITTTSASADSRQSVVHGLTTATAIWISAAIGVACGVGMFYLASCASLTTIGILRCGRAKKRLQKVVFHPTEKQQPTTAVPSSTGTAAAFNTNHMQSTLPTTTDTTTLHATVKEELNMKQVPSSFKQERVKERWDTHFEAVDSEDTDSDYLHFHVDNWEKWDKNPAIKFGRVWKNSTDSNGKRKELQKKQHQAEQELDLSSYLDQPESSYHRARRLGNTGSNDNSINDPIGP